MECKLDLEKIEKFTLKGGKYTYKRREQTYLLPLPTREPERAKFDKGFSTITGAVLRAINDKNIPKDANQKNIENIMNMGKFNDEESEEIFKYFVENQISEIENSNVTKFNQLEYIPFTENEKERKGEEDFFTFFYDFYIANNKEELQTLFKSLSEQDLISTILDLSIKEKKSKKQAVKYKNNFPELQQQFLADIKTLSTNPNFLIENISSLFVHYAFIAMAQLIIQTNKLTSFDESELSPIYFLLNWEKASKWRNGYKTGYKMLLEQFDGFFAHEHALNIVGLNTFSDKPNQYYHDIHQELQGHGPNEEKMFIKSIYDWMNGFYKVRNGIDDGLPQYVDKLTLDDAFKDLLSVIKKGISKEINSRYQKAFEAFISKFYRKNGGSLGTILSLKQDQLLMLVAVSVGNSSNRIELKQLWDELEKRGVWLDHHSKEEVVNTLDKLNYLDKKSDSGDAQYVKSIL
ncbi:DNA phosphorothioation-dependent restriction protein DptG [Paenisporosarcina sp. OV554]|uniref:DNA phosphorothioation-dependent restriction protein DptG n=1 Tax=Paenisporosarcina sp. OV554 TaxID=2135694 RepID=UPI000D3D0CE9|nr:DNA phosphorothioation-dependent restriction protein DptG [Paenisporosarcina sp. OV554]PUB13378.1 DNA phosphorothioation-dependent restriction protein DptG [Paenisporosarcina sp. OV554]